jgi:hypothetical protein
MRDLTAVGEVDQVVAGFAGVELYTGFRLGSRVVVKADKEELSPARSLAVFNHSPDGFNWGYGGSGPAQLALALLLREGVPDDVAVTLHQDLKWSTVVHWNQELNWLLRGSDLRYWIEQRLYEIQEKQLTAEGGPLDEP